MPTPGQLIRDARRRHGISQRQLALRAGTSQAWISRVERDELSPSVDSLDRLLLVMGERVELRTERLRHDDHDAARRAHERGMSVQERLERGLAFSEFADAFQRAARGGRS